MVVVILSRWPNVPWDTMTWVLAVCAILGPLVTYPFSKSLWLAIDLLFQPPRSSDFVTPSPPRGVRP
jgi:hypothetical protein